jgi:hypothetical protein
VHTLLIALVGEQLNVPLAGLVGGRLHTASTGNQKQVQLVSAVLQTQLHQQFSPYTGQNCVLLAPPSFKC